MCHFNYTQSQSNSRALYYAVRNFTKPVADVGEEMRVRWVMARPSKKNSSWFRLKGTD